MNYLLDTHTFLWFINDSPDLSDIAQQHIESPENILYLSIASVWEMAIKASLGKLEMPTPFADFIDAQLEQNSIALLTITTAHAELVTKLRFHHRDPFDRLIIAQAQVEGLPIIGKDAAFDAYDIECIW